MPLDEKKRREIEGLESKTEDQLLGILADQHPKYRTLRLSSTEKAKVGRQIMEKLHKQLFDKICVEWGYCKRRHDPSFQDHVSLAATIADLIATISIGVPPVTVAVLLVKWRLASFCKCDEDVSTTK